MEHRWVESREGGRPSREERKVSGMRKGRMELGQTSLKGGGEDESGGLWCWKGGLL